MLDDGLNEPATCAMPAPSDLWQRGLSLYYLQRYVCILPCSRLLLIEVGQTSLSGNMIFHAMAVQVAIKYLWNFVSRIAQSC